MSNSSSNRKCIVLFGPPGSGKGTQAELIANDTQYEHLSTGAILRAEINSKSKLGLTIRDILEKGDLVSDSQMSDVLISKLESTNNFILDGYPRNISQAEWLEKHFETVNIKIQAVIELIVPENILVERILERAKKSEVKRDDDNEESIKNRLLVFNKLTAPLRDYYKDSGVYNSINGTNSVEVIFQEIKELL